MNPSTNPNAAIKDRPDPRDYAWNEVGFGSAPFNWGAGFDIETLVGKLPVKDQGQSSSCGGQAWSQYAGVLEAVATGSLEERSAKFVYAQSYYPNGGGSTGRDNAAVFVKQGVSRETLCLSGAHDEAFYERPQDITDDARVDAKSDRSLSYVPNIAINMDTLAQAMRDNHGIILGISGQNNGTWGSAFPTPPTAEEWRHWVYVGKATLINGKKFLGLINSWGTTVGTQGWQWIGEDYLPWIWGTYTHVFNPAPLPPSFTHNFVSDLQFGENGGDITALQIALQIDGEFPKSLPATGFYGNVTRSAVLAFQLKYKIDSSANLLALQGKTVGPKTRAKLNELYNH